ncbi:MAG: hypothetical protein M1820_006158 [Bogoriella megaspora]|nr:MAG: hypothetical protein M1820_006158 [Bogoriella megaspora]
MNGENSNLKDSILRKPPEQLLRGGFVYLTGAQSQEPDQHIDVKVEDIKRTQLRARRQGATKRAKKASQGQEFGTTLATALEKHSDIENGLQGAERGQYSLSIHKERGTLKVRRGSNLTGYPMAALSARRSLDQLQRLHRGFRLVEQRPDKSSSLQHTAERRKSIRTDKGGVAVQNQRQDGNAFLDTLDKMRGISDSASPGQDDESNASTRARTSETLDIVTNRLESAPSRNARPESTSEGMSAESYRKDGRLEPWPVTVDRQFFSSTSSTFNKAGKSMTVQAVNESTEKQPVDLRECFEPKPETLKPMFLPTKPLSLYHASFPMLHSPLSSASQVKYPNTDPVWIYELEEAIRSAEPQPHYPPSFERRAARLQKEASVSQRKRKASMSSALIDAGKDLEVSPVQTTGSTSRSQYDALRIDYEGVYVPFANDIGAVVDIKSPWIKSDAKTEEFYGHARLNREIQGFNDWSKAAREEKVARDYIRKTVISNIQRVSGINEYRLVLFGSLKTSIGTITSDLDFRLDSAREGEHGPLNTRPSPQSSRVKFLRRMYLHLAKKGKDFILPVFRYARYPLITMQHLESGIDVQIVVSNAPDSSQWIRESRHDYPALRPVYFVVKALLETRGLTDVFRGGLGGYSIFGMVAASFKLHPEIATNDAARHLLAFLRFYSDFDTSKYGIDFTTPEIFPKAPAGERVKTMLMSRKAEKGSKSDSVTNENDIAMDSQDVITGEPTTVESQPLETSQADSKSDSLQRSAGEITDTKPNPPPSEKLQGRAAISRIQPSRPYLLTLQDPSNHFNDLGAKAFGIKHILATFRQLHAELERAVSSDAARSKDEPTQSLLEPLVGPTFGDYIEKRRDRLLQWWRNAKASQTNASRKLPEPTTRTLSMPCTGLTQKSMMTEDIDAQLEGVSASETDRRNTRNSRSEDASFSFNSQEDGQGQRHNRKEVDLLFG